MYKNSGIKPRFSLVISIMKFRTKKELLQYLGKNENDRKLVDRMMIKGIVHLVD